VRFARFSASLKVLLPCAKNWQLQSLIEPARPELPAVTITRPDLRLYDALLSEEVTS
jgi:hypothetical protein